MNTRETKNNKGFVILFAVTLSSILLAIALGASTIAFKELKFSTSARDTNAAFFAADTGVEYVLFLDKDPLQFPFPETAGASSSDEFVVSNLGGTNTSCAIVTITKDNANPLTGTTIVSKGYNTGDEECNSTNPNRVERQLRVTY